MSLSFLIFLAYAIFGIYLFHQVFTVFYFNLGNGLFRELLCGLIFAVIVAIPLGLLFGRFKTLFLYVNPVIQLLRPVSPLAWLPFIVLWFGIGDLPAAIIIFPELLPCFPWCRLQRILHSI